MNMPKRSIIIIFLFFTLLYYFLTLGQNDFYPLFLTISTFLFGIFAGFFIARQGSRYTLIREKISLFDGEMSSIYRFSGHLGKNFQDSIKKIIEKHYGAILDNKAWDYHLVRKSTTLTSIHELVGSVVEKKKKLEDLDNLTFRQVTTSLRNLQLIRKSMVALHWERIPKFQWLLIYFLAAVLIFALSMIPSHGFLLGAVLKGIFSTCVICVTVLLRSFDELKFFETIVGEKSAKDVLDIFVGKR